MPCFNLKEGYWVRTGELRRMLHRPGHKAHLGDALVAQCCIDYDVPLLTRDKDFKQFAKYSLLKLL